MNAVEKLIKNDLVKAIKKGDTNKKMALRMIIGESQRLNKKKDELITDSEMYSIIKGLIKSENILLKEVGRETSEYKEILSTYMPKQASEAEIREYIATVDLSTLKNKMQVIGMTKKHFGADNVDADLVKNIVIKL